MAAPARIDPDWLVPDWRVDGVGALMTTRRGGVSRAPFDSLNLRDGLGDDADAVAHNRARLADAIGAEPVYIEQVHGAAVVRLTAADARPGAAMHRADAAVTSEPGVVCAIQVADCLPVLFAAPHGRAVGAAHAGWRGLASGVLEATLDAVCEAARCEPAEVHAWLGPCIGARAFEVGRDVLDAFGALPDRATGAAEHFAPGASGASGAAGAPGKWLADLPRLARARLRRCGVDAIGGGTWCTVTTPSRFFSYRRDRVTGRMAATVWIGAAVAR